MATENKDQIPAFRVSAELFAAIEKEANDSFDSISGTARRALESYFAKGLQPAPKTEAVLNREKREAIRLEREEFEMAVKLREVVSIKWVMDFVRRDFAVMRSRIQAIKNAVLGLTDQQQADLNKAIEDCMTDLSCERDKWDDLG